jgi:photosystem II stability/assembly factor-like uncharacterized protein
MHLVLSIVAFVFTSIATLATAQANDVWQSFETGTQASLRGLAAVSKEVAWACGGNATVIQTIDGGKSWLRHPIPLLVDVEIRSIHAWDSDKAIVATAGQPALIMKTIDRGFTWTTYYENKSPQAFFDGMKFHNERSGIAFSDPVDGGLLIVRTEDGGDSWQAVEPSAIPKMDANEAGFAASNSSLHTFGSQLAWIGLGGGSNGPSRIFRSQDGGAIWTSQAVPPIARGMSSGIFAIAFENERNGIAVGGDYNKATSDIENIAISNDGGSTWRAPRTGRPRGFRSCVVLVPSNAKNTNKKFWLTCGPSGCDWSIHGEVWSGISEIGFHVLNVANDGSVWGAGSNGRIGRLNPASLLLRE